MAARGELVAAEVPSWKGTPFIPHQRVKGRGVDCKGFLWGVAEELGFPEAQSEYATTTDYNLRKKHGIPHLRLREGFAALFDQVEDMAPGDILLCRWDGKPSHIAIWDGERAWNAIPGSGVKSRSLACLFSKFPLDSVWRWRE